MIMEIKIGYQVHVADVGWGIVRGVGKIQLRVEIPGVEKQVYYRTEIIEVKNEKV